MSEIVEVSSKKCFGGYQKVFSHESNELKCSMKFGVYLPPEVEVNKYPVLYFLSGLTCTEQNFILKSGAQRFASKYGIIVVNPDTSPRGCNLPNECEKWNVGCGAGMYINATKEPWSKHYRMYSYITDELPALIEKNFPVLPEKQSIMGHSMGGHGALMCAFRNPGKYKSVSAFAPACNINKCKGFHEAVSLYIGGAPNDETWNEWSANNLVKNYDGPPLSILIDVGTKDEFLEDLHVSEFVEACTDSRVITLALNMREGYDHGYFFISTFIEDHFKHHVQFLK